MEKELKTGEHDELLPARMVNEFVNCPRLFYFEWVRKEWASNDDTDEGDLAHHSVGRRGGVMPEPDAEDPPLTTAEVSLACEELGLVATIDRVDHRDGTCSPVDYKKGRAPDHGVWPGDEAQILVQALLLERAGYTVSEGFVSYLASRCRRSVAWTDDARSRILAVVSEARAAADLDTAPPPLINSPKCPRCSLASLCLPDETNSLLNRSDSPPRSIVPRDPSQQPLYLVEQGTQLGVSGKKLTVTVRGEALADIRMIDVSHVCAVGNVQITSQAVNALLRAGRSIVYLSYGGYLNGFTQGPVANHVEIRRQQVLQAGSRGLDIVRAIVSAKIANQRTLLMRNAKGTVPQAVLDRMKQLSTDAQAGSSIPTLMGLEGAAAREYFQHFHSMLSAGNSFADRFAAEGRKRRPAPDPVNALLGFSYALLTKELLVATTAVGLDPYMGFLHQPRFGRPALALDLMEEFRPLIADSVVIQCVNNGEVRETDFLEHSLGVQLKPDARKRVVRAFERRMSQQITHPIFKYKISYRRVVDVQCRLLAATLLQELPAYQPMRTR